MEKSNLTKFETKENTELNLVNSSSSSKKRRQQNKVEEEHVVRKYEIYIDLEKSKKPADGKTKSEESNFIKNGTPKSSTSGREIDSILLMSDDDSDSGAKFLPSNLSDAESSVEGSLSLLQNLSEPTSTVQLYNNKNEDAPQDVSKAPHFVKYVNKNGKVIKIWECGICARNFQHQYTLMRHLPTHTNIRNYVCNECGKAFRQLSTLSQHRAIHSIDRPYSCETCNKAFNRISTLISHRKTHSEIKPFRCPICNKGFHQKGNLRNHIYIHTNARPYRCSICNKGFNQMSNLVCHTQKSHSEEIALWRCHRCNMSFSKRHLLRTHELETHQIQAGTKYFKTKSLYSQKNNFVVPPNSTPLKKNDEVIQSQISQNGILIPAIETDAMKTAKANKEIPFAVLHFLEGVPIIVRIIEFESQSLLRPVNNEDVAALKQRQKDNPEKKLQIAVVAAVYQILNYSGMPEFAVTSPRSYICPSTQTISLDVDCDKTASTAKPMNPEVEVLPPQPETIGSLIDINRIEEVSELCEAIASVRPEESLALEESDVVLNEIIEIADISDIKMKEEEPKAIAIVEDNNWNQITAENTEGKEVAIYSETFQNIATGNLLSPNRVPECDFLVPAQNGNDNFNFNLGCVHSAGLSTENQMDCCDCELLNNFLSNVIYEGMDVDNLRNLLSVSDSQKFWSDFDSWVAELLPS